MVAEVPIIGKSGPGHTLCLEECADWRRLPRRTKRRGPRLWKRSCAMLADSCLWTLSEDESVVDFDFDGNECADEKEREGGGRR